MLYAVAVTKPFVLVHILLGSKSIKVQELSFLDFFYGMGTRVW